MRVTNVRKDVMYHVEGMKRPEPVFDHFYYDPTVLDIEVVRKQASAAKHSVIIHYHGLREKCSSDAKHEYYGEQNLE